MCIGSKWATKYRDVVNTFGEKNTLHILTDEPSTFQKTTTHLYTREVFSYYEKINFILNLSKKLKQQICYIDVDWIESYNTDLNFDDKLYTYHNFDLDGVNELTNFFTEKETKVRKKILSKIGVNKILNDYIGEALIVFPYLENIDDIIEDSKILQEYIEKEYNSNSITHKRLDRYKDGIGYAEGWGITALCIKYNIPIVETNWRKQRII